MRTKRLLTLFCVLAAVGCASWGARVPSKPGVYTVVVEPVHVAQLSVHATYVRPHQDKHPGLLLIFMTGDEGWFATSRALFGHLADSGYVIAGFGAPEFLSGVSDSERMSTAAAAQAYKELFAEAKHHLGLAESTPILMVGFSRGASAVAFAAVHPDLRNDIKGAVAIALTRESDYLHASYDQRKRGIEVDEKDRIQLYPALKLLGSIPLAVIQSTNDPYVPAAESRQLLGPDTSFLRLYTVDAKDHSFSDAQDKLMQDLDDALRWIER